MYNIPNILTLSRIAVIPLIFLSAYFPWAWYAYFTAILFIAASITDYFDGYLARLYNQTSAFGRLFDPIADKLLVVSALVVILIRKDYFLYCPLSYIPVFIIFSREILVSGLREFLREFNVGLPVTKLAKWKTGFQMTALSMVLFHGWYWGALGEILLWIAGVLTFITGYQYFQHSLDYVKNIEGKKETKNIQPKNIETKKKVSKKVEKKPAKKTVRKKRTVSKKTTKSKSSK